MRGPSPEPLPTAGTDYPSIEAVASPRQLKVTLGATPTWLRFLAAGLVVCAIDAAVGSPVARAAVLVIIACASLTAIGVGVYRHRPANHTMWWSLVAGTVLLATATILASRQFVSRPSDALAVFQIARLAGYTLYFVAVLYVSQTRRRSPGIDSLLDSLILGTAVALFTWRAVLSRALDASTIGRAQVFVAYGIPALDVVLLTAILRRVLAAERPPPALRLMLCAVAVGVVSHLVSGLAVINNSTLTEHAPIEGAMFVLLGATALHPSMRQLTVADQPRIHHYGATRIGILALALLDTPLLILLYRNHQSQQLDSTVAVGSGVITVIVVVRLISLARDADKANARERAREQRFESLIRNSADLLAVVDIDRHLDYVSPAVSTMFGYSADDAIGVDILPLVHPDDVSEIATVFERLAPGESSDLLLLRLRNANGRWRWVEVRTVNLLMDPSVRGLVVNGRDVTERIAAEQLLVISGIQQSSVAQLGREALGATDRKSVVVSTAVLVRATLDVDSCTVLLLGRAGVVDGVIATWDNLDDVGPETYAGSPILDAALAIDVATQYVDDTPDVALADMTQLDERPLLSTRTLEGEVASPISSLNTNVDPTILVARVVVKDHNAGLIVVRSLAPRTFTVNEASFLDTMAGTLGLAIGRRNAEESAQHQALHDDLTTLPNRGLFVDRLTLALAHLERQSGCVAVLFMDIDHFKVINDSLGHSAGDRILTEVASRLQKLLRPGDTVARFGGDEFTLLLDHLDGTDEAIQVAGRIRTELAAAVTFGGAQLHPTVSIGISVATSFTSSAESMLRDADAAMYRAKERGRDRVEVFDETMRDRAILRLRTEIDLRRALRRDELVLHYQPVVDLVTGESVGLEALVRWQHPRQGLIYPANFIPIAEQSGLIGELSAWIFSEAMRASATWTKELGSQAPVVAINVSARSLASQDLPSRLAAAIKESSASPEHLCLEITESALMDDVERSAVMLGQLKSLGVQLAIDDFGTGYSSLTYLKRFPVDILKIDGSFINGLERNTQDSAIIAAVIGLAATLGRIAIAEGVETPRQLLELRRLDCPRAQGYLLGRPVPAELVCFPKCFDLGTLVEAVKPAVT